MKGHMIAATVLAAVILSTVQIYFNMEERVFIQEFSSELCLSLSHIQKEQRLLFAAINSSYLGGPGGILDNGKWPKSATSRPY